MVNLQSVMNSPLVSDMLIMHVMVSGQVALISFDIGLLIWSSSQHLFFIPIISLLSSSCVSSLKLVNFCVICFFPDGIAGCL